MTSNKEMDEIEEVEEVKAVMENEAIDTSGTVQQCNTEIEATKQTVTAKKDEGKILQQICHVVPTSICTANLKKMRHIRCCHILKGVVGRCEGCGKDFQLMQ